MDMDLKRRSCTRAFHTCQQSDLPVMPYWFGSMDGSARLGVAGGPVKRRGIARTFQFMGPALGGGLLCKRCWDACCAG